MTTEDGDTIYTEARVDRRVNLEVEAIEGMSMRAILTTKEARTLASALLAAVVEAEAYGH